MPPTMPKKRAERRDLGSKQLAVIDLVRQGYKNAEIGERLGTSEHVIKNYLREIFDRVGVWSRLELALWAEHKLHERNN